MLPPRADDGPWHAADVRRTAGRIVAVRLSIASGALAGALVAVMACGIVLSHLGDEPWPWVAPSRAALWELFQRAGIAEALVATPLTFVVLTYAGLADERSLGIGRALAASIAAAVAHVILWPLMLLLVSKVFDGISPREVAGTGENGTFRVAQFVFPVLFACVPLGVAYGMGFEAVVLIMRAWLEPATGRALFAARWLSLVVVGIALGGLAILARCNHLEPYWLAVPNVVLGASFVVDVVVALALAIRGRVWLSALRAGRVADWRLVPVSLATVGEDLAPVAPSDAPMLALVPASAPTYRGLPEAVALVPPR